MSGEARRVFIATGLPILFDSAKSLLSASAMLTDSPREADILEHQAQEECAKALILVDLMRCPANLVAARTGPMMHWFYDHLARLIYSEAQHWRPVTAADLQNYIDDQRKSHYLEGEYGEYIMPNSALFRRESVLYADVTADEEGNLEWLSPQVKPTGLGHMNPMSFKIVDALSALGVFTPAGMKIMHDVWSATPIIPETRWEVTRDNYMPMAKALEAAGLFTERAADDHLNIIANYWQMPMYGMDFSQIDVPLEDLLAEQEAQYPYMG
jgi:hypothetical protein